MFGVGLAFGAMWAFSTVWAADVALGLLGLAGLMPGWPADRDGGAQRPDGIGEPVACNSARVTASETISLVLTALFGLVSSIGVAYQVIDMRRRPQQAGPPDQPTPAPSTPEPPLAPVSTGWQQPTFELPSLYTAARQRAAAAASQQSAAASPASTPLMRPSPAFSMAAPMTAQQISGPATIGTPRVVVLTRVLLLITSVLSAVSVALLFYIVEVESDQSTTATAAEESVAYWLGGLIVFLIIAIPLSTIPTVLSVFIGRGHNWARICATTVAGVQAVLCTCGGAVLPFTEPTNGTPSGEYSAAGNLSLGLTGVAIGLVSTVITIMLYLPDSNTFFQALTQQRHNHPTR